MLDQLHPRTPLPPSASHTSRRHEPETAPPAADRKLDILASCSPPPSQPSIQWHLRKRPQHAGLPPFPIGIYLLHHSLRACRLATCVVHIHLIHLHVGHRLLARGAQRLFRLSQFLLAPALYHSFLNHLSQALRLRLLIARSISSSQIQRMLNGGRPRIAR